jgi:hypothetical protein
MDKQTEHYQRLLNNPASNKGADGKPLVTQAQLDYAKKNGFGDIDGKNGIDGLELAVAELDGKKGIGAKDGDLNGDGKVNKEDRGVSLGSSSQSNKGLDTGKLMAFIDELIKIWAPRAAGNTSAAPANDISTALKKIMEAAKTRTTTTPTLATFESSDSITLTEAITTTRHAINSTVLTTTESTSGTTTTTTLATFVSSDSITLTEAITTTRHASTSAVLTTTVSTYVTSTTIPVTTLSLTYLIKIFLFFNYSISLLNLITIFS